VHDAAPASRLTVWLAGPEARGRFDPATQTAEDRVRCQALKSPRRPKHCLPTLAPSGFTFSGR